MMSTYELLANEGREMVDDIVGEMTDMSWPDRRTLVNRLLQVAEAAMQVRAEVMPERAWSRGEVIEGVVGDVLAAVLEELGEECVVCDDSATVFALSANQHHRMAATSWRTANPCQPNPWENGQPTLH